MAINYRFYARVASNAKPKSRVYDEISLQIQRRVYHSHFHLPQKP